jgi:hypothetical protein
LSFYGDVEFVGTTSPDVTGERPAKRTKIRQSTTENEKGDDDDDDSRTPAAAAIVKTELSTTTKTVLEDDAYDIQVIEPPCPRRSSESSTFRMHDH